MARLIVKSPYIKPGGKKSPGGHLKYIATREGVEMAEDTSRHLPATDEQQKEIARVVKKHPDSKDGLEYADFIADPTRDNADAFLSAVYECYPNDQRRDIYLKYISERPGVQMIGSNGLFTDEGVPIVLAKVQQEMNESQSNIWTHIISLHREDAERLGYNTPEGWMNLLRSQRNNIAKQMKIAPENFRWYAAFHNEGHHPHVHMMAYSTDPHEAYLSKQGIENIKSSLAKEIFQQDLMQIYQKQTEVRDELHIESKERIHRIVEKFNHGDYQNPHLEQLLLELAEKLKSHKGKKVYGYLNTSTKRIVDTIVAELASDPQIQKLYKLWYEQREDVLRTYTDTFPKRIPLEQNKEFQSIRNAVIQAASKLAKEDIPSAEKSPPSAPCVPVVPLSPSQPDVSPPPQPFAPVVPAVKPVQKTAHVSVKPLLLRLAKLIQSSADRYYDEHVPKYRAIVDRKERQKIEEKKQALGIRSSGYEEPQM